MSTLLRWSAVLAVLAALVATAAAQEAPGSTDDEWRSREKLREARREVDSRSKTRDARLRERDAAAGPEKTAREALDKARFERQLAERIDESVRNPEANPSDALKRLKAHIKEIEEELERLTKEAKETTGNLDLALALGANANYLERLYAKRDAMVNGGTPEEKKRKEEWRRAAREVALRKIDAYWDAQGTWRHASSELAQKQGLLDGAEADLARAQAALAALEAELEERFRKAPPAFVLRASAEAGGARVYDASWVSEEAVLDERIAFMRKAVVAQAREIEVQTRRRDAMLTSYLEASDESIAAIKAYEEAIWTQAYRSIFIDMADSATSLALAFKDGGIVGLGVTAAVDLGSKLYDYGSGSIGRRYEMPSTAANGPPPAHDAMVYVGQEGKTVVKSAIKTTLKALIEGGRAGAADYRRLVDAEPFIQELWVLLKRRVIFGNRVSEQAIVLVFRETSEALVVRSLRDRITGALGAFKDGLKKGLINPKVLRSTGRSMAQAAVKTFLIEMARSERLEAWANFTEKEAVALAIYRQMRQESNLLQFEKLQFEAYQEYLKELLEERRRATASRRLRVDKDEAIPASARAADGSIRLELRLEFSRDVDGVRVNVNGKPAEGEAAGAVWRGKVTVPAGESVAQVSVEGRDILSKVGIDAQPRTVSSFNAPQDSWMFLEGGADNTHAVRLGDRKPGVSIVILVDCSGSMDQNERMKRAKTAARGVLRPESLGPDDEVALWTFAEYDARLRVEFTSDVARVASVVESLNADGNTPLALGIMKAGDFLLTAGRNRKKVLIVLSDGEETNNGNPIEAMRRLRIRGAEIREELR